MSGRERALSSPLKYVICRRLLQLIYCPNQLETDGELIVPKARVALERYGHQVVIGNDLNHRKYEVVFVSRKASSPSPHASGLEENTSSDDDDNSSFVESWLRINPPSSSPVLGNGYVKEIEEDIVVELVRRHEQWISAG
jgi:phosphopantothenate---cysteine ligase (ATP)